MVGGIRRAQTHRPPPRWLRIPPRRLQQPWWPAHAPSGVGALPTTLLYAQPLSRGAALAPTGRVQSLFEPNTANRPRKPYKPLLASNFGSDGAEPREDPAKHLTLDQRMSPGAPSPLSRRRASTLTAAAPAPPEAGRATDHLSSEERVLARRARDGGVGAAGLAALVSNHAPESPRSPQVRRASTLSTAKLSGGLHNRRRTVGDAAHHQQARRVRTALALLLHSCTALALLIHTALAPHLWPIPSQAHAAAAFRAAREAGWTLKAHLENLDQQFSDSIAMPQSETTTEAALPATIKATPAAEFAAAVPPTAPSALPPAAPPAALSHILAQPPEEPPQERSSPPRSRQPTKEYIDTREEARVQRRRVSQLICGPVVAQLICGPGVELYRG